MKTKTKTKNGKQLIARRIATQILPAYLLSLAEIQVRGL